MQSLLMSVHFNEPRVLITNRNPAEGRSEKEMEWFKQKRMHFFMSYLECMWKLLQASRRKICEVCVKAEYLWKHLQEIGGGGDSLDGISL